MDDAGHAPDAAGSDLSWPYHVRVDGIRCIPARADAAEFSQRMHLTIADDGQTIASIGEMCRDGGSWEPDLQLTYTRATAHNDFDA